MKRTIRVEIIGSDAFWRNAVMVEWEYQFPQRKLIAESSGYHLIEADWLDDLERVAGKLFSKVLVAPADPSRRQWFRRLLPNGERR
ncbi:MAG TPA: hypothetical protein VD966_13660 [Pyrinomonadaceae bacterium]|nr:hypothetical protein [Pyrinomonadaceae bacterium]